MCLLVARRVESRPRGGVDAVRNGRSSVRGVVQPPIEQVFQGGLGNRGPDETSLFDQLFWVDARVDQLHVASHSAPGLEQRRGDLGMELNPQTAPKAEGLETGVVVCQACSTLSEGELVPVV